MSSISGRPSSDAHRPITGSREYLQADTDVRDRTNAIVGQMMGDHASADEARAAYRRVMGMPGDREG